MKQSKYPTISAWYPILNIFTLIFLVKGGPHTAAERHFQEDIQSQEIINSPIWMKIDKDWVTGNVWGEGNAYISTEDS